MSAKVIFIHPLKTGGTSIRYMLLREYGRERIAPVPMGDVFGIQTEDYPTMGGYPLQVQERITADCVDGSDVVMSHYDWGIVGRLPDWDVITMLREPVAQLRSLYQYMAARPQMFSQGALMASMGFDSWVRSDLVRPYLNNQTAFLSGHDRRRVDEAVGHLSDERMHFGLLERFSESVARWNVRFGWSMVVERRNEAPRPLVLDAGTRDYVAVLQGDDMILWREAVRLFG